MMSGDDTSTIRMRKDLLTFTEASPTQKHAAARIVATNATDIDDCAKLLSMLGLTPQDGGANIERALERGL